MLLIVLANIIGIIGIGYLISYSRKSNQEAKRGYEEYNKPENIFKRQSLSLGYKEILFTDRRKYPYITLPSFDQSKKGKNSDIFNFTNNIKIGRSEKLLYDLLIKKYGTELIKGCGEYNYYGYYPDIAYVDSINRIYIDIEIDEIYDLKTKSPIHFYDQTIPDKERKWTDLNYDRDYVFQKYGWTVIRFSEEQVLKNYEECSNIIDYVINYWSRKRVSYFSEYSSIQLSDRWDFEAAKKYSNENYRDLIYHKYQLNKN